MCFSWQAILERSGVGQSSRLAQLGIECVVDNGNVGENMCDHLQLRTVFKMGRGVSLNSMYHSWPARIGMGVEYLAKRSGPLSMAPSQLGCFTRSDAGRDAPNIQYHVQPLSLDKFGDPLHTFDAMTVSVCNLQPTSRGSTHIQSRDDPTVAPVIVANYLSTPGDVEVAVDSIRVTRSIAAQAALRSYELQEYLPGAALQSRDELARAAGAIGTTIFHPTSTAAMGRVLDSEFRVMGVQGLRVCDASAMPFITSGNTCSPTLVRV